MKTISTRAMVEGAVLAALTAIMGIFYNVPIAQAITMFWSVPIIIVGYRNGFKVSMIAAFIAAVLVSLIVTPIVGIILFATYAIPGAVMGYMMRKQISPNITLILCGALLAVTAALQLALSLGLILGVNVIDIIKNLDASINSYFSEIYSRTSDAAQVYTKFGMGEADIKEALQKLDLMLKQFKLLLPSSLLAGGLVTSYFNFKMVKIILNRIGSKVQDVKRFSMWSVDTKYRYIILGITFILLLVTSQQVPFLYSSYTNLYMLLMLFYAVFGLSVIVYYIEQISEKYEIQKPVKTLMLIGLPLLLLAILPYIGMFDIAANVRRLDRNIPGGAR
ncbi:MAG: conserved rane protein of unknown function [Clostridia bacterium]|jgi:uncharacterized protein YybS (DUF2232 family)|nr:conserved rane protein of unknown function [Clostridia bacterium]